MLSLWHTHGSAPRSSYPVCQILARWKHSELDRKTKCPQEKKAGRRASICFVVGTFFCILWAVQHRCSNHQPTSQRPHQAASCQRKASHHVASGLPQPCSLAFAQSGTGTCPWRFPTRLPFWELTSRSGMRQGVSCCCWSPWAVSTRIPADMCVFEVIGFSLRSTSF